LKKTGPETRLGLYRVTSLAWIRYILPYYFSSPSLRWQRSKQPLRKPFSSVERHREGIFTRKPTLLQSG